MVGAESRVTTPDGATTAFVAPPDGYGPFLERLDLWRRGIGARTA